MKRAQHRIVSTAHQISMANMDTIKKNGVWGAVQHECGRNGQNQAQARNTRHDVHLQFKARAMQQRGVVPQHLAGDQQLA